MSISALNSTSTVGTGGSGASASQSTGATSAVSQFLSQADQRILADMNATTAQLSSFGLLKSAVASGQTAAQALTALSANATATSVTKTAADFFNAFNAMVQSAQDTTAVPGSTQAAHSAARVSRDLKWALSSGGATGDAMRKLGFKLQADGSLTHDAQAFAAALNKDPAGVRAALATLGKQVASVAGKELATGGSVAASLASLTQHSTALTAQQQAILKLNQAMASGSTSSGGGSGLNGGYNGQGWSAYLANQDG